MSQMASHTASSESPAKSRCSARESAGAAGGGGCDTSGARGPSWGSEAAGAEAPGRGTRPEPKGRQLASAGKGQEGSVSGTSAAARATPRPPGRPPAAARF
eukprot:4810508-Alexandrium_andersonii.AAC.1